MPHHSYQNQYVSYRLDESDEIDYRSQQQSRFQVCIELGDDRKGTIKLNQHSDPLLCALEFCHKFQLEEDFASILCQIIKQKIDEEVNKLKLQKKAEERKISKSFENSKKHSKMHESQVQGNQEDNRKPKINQISKIIVDKMGKRSILQQIQINRKKKEEKVQKIKKQIENKQLSQCSFKPKINLISEKVDTEMKGQKRNRYEDLYNRALANKQNKIPNQYQKNTFKPKINNMSRKYVQGLNFEQRQQRFKHKQIQDNSGLNKQQYHPKVGRGPCNRNVQNLPIGQYLYEQSKNKKSNELLHQIPNRLTTLQKSENIVQNLKQARIRQIFNVMDTDQDGLVRFDAIDFDRIDPVIVEIFTPLLQQMQELDIQLQFRQFLEASERLLCMLTLHEKNYILNTKKKVSMSDQCTFQPIINKKSQTLASSKSRDLYARSVIEKQNQSNKIEREREERVRNELYQCTFKPKITHYTITANN